MQLITTIGSFLRGRLLLAVFLIIIGIFSIVVTILRNPVTSVYFQRGKIKTTAYNIIISNNLGEAIFIVSPLNDYLYNGSEKNHVFDKFEKGSSGSISHQLWLSLKNLVFEDKIMLWRTAGKNLKGSLNEDYEVVANSNKIEIKRKIDTNREVLDGIGQVVNFCPSCVPVDDKKRLYSNGNFLSEGKFKLAKDRNFTIVAIGENQSFPPDVKKISFFDGSGKLKFEAAVSGNQIFLQDKWHLLEFKSLTKKGQTATVKQIFYFP